jgi:Flp pilus assembly protein TadD
LKHGSPVHNAVFSPDGRMLLTACGGEVHLWDSATGQPLAPPLPHTGFISGMAFSPDGRRVLTACDEGAVWDLPHDDRPVAELQRLAALLSGQRLDPRVVSVRVEPAELAATWDWLRPRYPSDFAATPRQVRMWHRREAEVAWNARDWSAAVLHFDRAIAAGPAERELYDLRGNAHAELGQWDKATADFAKTVALAPEDWDTWSDLALARLASGDQEGYRDTCANLLDRFAGTEDPIIAMVVAFTCALAPNAVKDTARLVALAEKAVAGRAGDRVAHYTLGAALYRAGRFDAAVRRLNEAPAASGEEDAAALLLLSMAHSRLGHAEEARQWLEQGVRRMEQIMQPGPGGAGGLPWWQRLMLQLTRREAEALVGPRIGVLQR